MEANFLDRIQFTPSITFHYLFPIMTMGLPALDPTHSLTIQNAKAASCHLSTRLFWWPIAIGYFTFLFRTFEGKVAMDDRH